MYPIKTFKRLMEGDTGSKSYETNRQSFDPQKCILPIKLHNCHGKSERQYNARDLSVNSLWRMYNFESTVELGIKKSFFSNYINTNYNIIDFGSPASDVCSQYLEATKKIQFCKNNKDKKLPNYTKKSALYESQSFF